MGWMLWKSKKRLHCCTTSTIVQSQIDVYVYDKGEAEDLTAAQKKELRAIAEAIKQEYRR